MGVLRVTARRLAAPAGLALAVVAIFAGVLLVAGLGWALIVAGALTVPPCLFGIDDGRVAAVAGDDE